jgi:hypothetical protein
MTDRHDTGITQSIETQSTERRMTTKNWKDIATVEQPRGREELEVYVQYPNSHSGTPHDYIGIIFCEDSVSVSVESVPALIEALLRAQQHIEDREAAISPAS